MRLPKNAFHHFQVSNLARPVVAIVGRSNVGKSTLFNRLNAEGLKTKAVTDAAPGVTRDRNYALGEWKGWNFWLVDTGGMELLSPVDRMLELMRKQTEIAISQADLVLFMVDSSSGLILSDLEVARLLIRAKKRTLLVVNKCESLFNQTGSIALSEFYNLGIGEPIPISALHGLNINELLDRVVVQISPYDEGKKAELPISIALVGKPNVGKSSLFNGLLGEERVIVDHIPGTTRDAIDTSFYWKDREFVLIDTAGIRKKSRVNEPIERYSLMRSLKAIERSDITLLIVDAQEGVSVQDKRILAKMLEAGCAGIIVVNKWDTIKEQWQNKDVPLRELRAKFKEEIQVQVPFLTYLPFIFISALKREGLTKLMGLIEKTDFEYNRWINTGQLNKVITNIYNRSRPPSVQGKALKIYYATQVKTSPPSFLLFVNHPRWMSEAYMKYLEKQLRQSLGFVGTPIRILIRQR